MIFLAHCPKSLTFALANPDETKAVVLEKPGPERQTGVFLATRVAQVMLPAESFGDAQLAIILLIF
jgi:hypothetical protein